jgi:hypothetical protein
MASTSLPPKPTRDSVTTIAADGSRVFLHPASVKGRFARARTWSAYALIALYVLLPWIPINGAPAVFLDIAGRRFHLFGATLAFQDAWLLFFVITGLAFSLFYVTALFGRVWCGWACPQTVFLEHVFRRVEALLEGDAVARRALDQSIHRLMQRRHRCSVAAPPSPCRRRWSARDPRCEGSDVRCAPGLGSRPR